MKFWDLLYQRYGNPLELLQQMVETGQLAGFITELVQIRNEELQEKTMWEYYLHRVYDMTFDEFVQQNKEPETPETMGKDRMVEIVKDSLDILARQ